MERKGITGINLKMHCNRAETNARNNLNSNYNYVLIRLLYALSSIADIRKIHFSNHPIDMKKKNSLENNLES